MYNKYSNRHIIYVSYSPYPIAVIHRILIKGLAEGCISHRPVEKLPLVCVPACFDESRSISGEMIDDAASFMNPVSFYFGFKKWSLFSVHFLIPKWFPAVSKYQVKQSIRRLASFWLLGKVSSEASPRSTPNYRPNCLFISKGHNDRAKKPPLPSALH